jgi:hypothetical protein
MFKPILLLVLGVSLSAAVPVRAQSAAVQQLILDISKLARMKSILQDMYVYYTTLDEGYEGIKGVAGGNYNLHETFLDGLLLVSPNVQNDPRVAAIVSAQLQIVQEYESALNRFKADPHFTAAEVDYFASVYARLLSGSMEDLHELTAVLTAGTLRMSDDERLSAIDRIHRRMEDKLAWLRVFNNSVSIQSARRGRASGDLLILKNLYGL